jgi:hypothetical protein
MQSDRQTLFLKPNFSDYSPEAAASLLADTRRTLARYLGSDLDRALPPGPLWSVASDVVVARDLSEDDMRELMVACCRYLGLYQRKAQAPPPRPVKAPVQVIRINDFAFLALPGEVMVEVGQAWSTLMKSPTAFIIGLANAHLRYLPMASHFAEPEAAVRYETVTAGLQSGEVEIALDHAAAMMSRLGER